MNDPEDRLHIEVQKSQGRSWNVHFSHPLEIGDQLRNTLAESIHEIASIEVFRCGLQITLRSGTSWKTVAPRTILHIVRHFDRLPISGYTLLVGECHSVSHLEEPAGIAAAA